MTNKIDTYKLAMELVRWCKKNKCWDGVVIYFNGKAWSSQSSWPSIYEPEVEGKKIGYDLYEYADRNPKDYFSSAKEPNILSMSFEGELYRIINGYRSGSTALRRQLGEIFHDYGLYHHYGDAWNLTAYEKQEEDAMWDDWVF